MEELGIDLLKKASKAIIDVVEEGQTALADGKLQLTEIIGLFDNGYTLVKLYSKRDEILAQLKDVNSEERKELFEYIKEEYDAPEESADLIIDKVIDILEQGFELYEQGVIDFIEKVKDLISTLKQG